MRDVHPREGRLAPCRRGRGIGGRRADHPVERGLLQQPARLFLGRVDRIEPVPGDMAGRDGGDRLDGRFVRPEDREKIAVAQDLDRRPRSALLGSPANGRLVDGSDRRAAARLAHHAGMHHALHHHVVDKNRRAEHLGGEIDARRAPADDLMFARQLDRRPAAGMAREIDALGERPIIMAGRRAAVGDRAIAHCEVGAGIA